jgi:hypothetical protein
MVDNPRSARIRKTPRARKRNLILGRCLGTARGCKEPRVAKSEGLAAAVWWSQTESNRRPHACKARALPTELWPLSRRSAKRSNPRTHSIGPRSFDARMVGLGRLELPTSRLSSARSNQLSYKPQAQASPCAKPALARHQGHSPQRRPDRAGSSRKKEKRRRRSPAYLAIPAGCSKRSDRRQAYARKSGMSDLPNNACRPEGSSLERR